MRANLSNDVDNDADGDDDDDYDDGDDDEEEGARMRMRMIFIGATCGFFFFCVCNCVCQKCCPQKTISDCLSVTATPKKAAMRRRWHGCSSKVALRTKSLE